ncbi:MAG: SigE family RNA polymerase sigma factor [Ilumatobacter sp.]|uniref:RNA polymerase sigma factor n=1 Tax=Ilumatobacter sp. TaxID=1967498 RepID=UPI002634E626|nr:SigE family RNA polymerase sigma factor [Ilumatobacter sp.]MDJ0767790.1 SigE family RNA polymerase sigma factor [Ilumatobacter sp.]
MMYATADSGSRPAGNRPDLRVLEGGSEVRQEPPGQTAPVVAGADEGVVELYEAEYVGLARLAYLLVADRHRAEDLAHDAFAKLYEKWDDLDDHDKAPAWLRTTVTNLAMSSHRRSATARKHAAQTPSDQASEAAASAESEALGRSTNPQIVSALQALSPKQRTAVVLKHWLRYTESEIADVLGCSLGSVRTHLHRGHAALAASLGGQP